MGVLDVLLPPACAACGAFGSVLCDACRGTFRAASDPGDRFFAPDPGVVVGTRFRLAAAAFIYEGALRRALQRLKYAGVARLAGPLADAALPAMRELLAETGPTRLVPVPLHVGRQRERGYNQAALLARELGRRARLPVLDVLVRPRPTVKQHKLDRAARARNLAAAFEIRRGARSPRDVLLIDDIMTTSATLEACAAVLETAGAEAVYGFTIAREI